MDTEDLIHALTGIEQEKLTEPAVLPSGSVSLDILLGGGWRKGAVSELYGPPDCGTTTVALRTIAAVQRAYPAEIAVMYDNSPGSGSRLPGYAEKLGADLDRLVIATQAATLPVMPQKAAITVIDGFSGGLLPPREDLEGTVLVISRKPGLRAAVSVGMQRSYRARWAWADLPAMLGVLPVPVSLGAHPWVQEILQTAILYGLAETRGKRWYYCGSRKFAGGWHDAVQTLRDDAELRDKIINGIAEKTGLDGSNWLASPAFSR